jgi:hypothetical protein
VNYYHPFDHDWQEYSTGRDCQRFDPERQEYVLCGEFGHRSVNRRACCSWPKVPNSDGECVCPSYAPNCDGAAGTDPQSCAESGMYWNFTEGYCQDSPWYCTQEPQNCGLSFMWSTESCRCEYTTPVVVDVLGDGFRMTDAAGGVNFDLNHDGTVDRVS